MAHIRYRANIKTLCNECESLRNSKRRFDTKCTNCNWLKYNNVNDLLSFTAFLHKEFPTWVFFNVFEYVKGEKGRLLASFQKGKNEPVNRHL